MSSTLFSRVIGQEHNRILNGLCTVGLVNDIPCDYGATVTAAAVEFFYDGGGSYIDSAPSMSLSCGQTATFRSSDASKCVVKMHLVCKIEVQGEAKPQLFDQTVDVPNGRCALHEEFKLTPKRTMSMPETASAKFGDRIALIVTNAQQL